MATITPSSGIRVTFPDTLRIIEDAKVEVGTRGRRRGPAPNFEAMATEAAKKREAALISEALKEQDFELIQTLTFAPSDATARTVRESVKEEAKQEIEIETTVEGDKDAIILLEQDGMYMWMLPAKRADAATGPSARRRRGEVAQRKETFRISLATAIPQQAERKRRGLLADFMVGRVQAIIFKFAGRFLLDRAATFLERHVRPGVMVMDGNDPTAWRRVGDFSAVNLPPDRTTKILLFVHGTFSNTKGGFGGLGATEWGRAFLMAARTNYDAVLGFDHPTLSVDPLANATDLLHYLEARKWDHQARVDVICHSRGAITLRCLTEYLLPASSLPVKVEKVVFVGGVNSGTNLAKPENWKSFIDLYTNLAVGASRAIALFPQATFAATLLGEMLKSVGTLAKILVKEGVTGQAVPGLAAMEPEGHFITELNKTQPGQPRVVDADYYAVTSEFHANLVGPTSELPKKLLLTLVDGLVDQILRESNDLVVHTASMTTIDPQAGTFIKDKLAFMANGVVYHTNYFLQPQVTDAMARWLGMETARATRPRRRGLVEAGPVVGTDMPARVDIDILVVQASDMGAEAEKVITRESPYYVVVERLWSGKLLRYGFEAEEVLKAVRLSPDQDLLISLNLHEMDASAEIQKKELAAGMEPEQRPSGFQTPRSQLTVVMDRGMIVGVAERTAKAMPVTDLVELEKRWPRRPIRWSEAWRGG